MQTLELCRAILFVKDMDKMADYYCNTLGVTQQSDDNPDWRTFDTGAGQLAFHSIPEPWREDVQISDPPETRHSATVKLVFYVENLEQARDELIGKGIDVPDNANLNAPGEFVRFDIVDPEGNVVQLTSERVR
jgi:extradiol dioxygenase family protein